jgi:hypothetical protein
MFNYASFCKVLSISQVNRQLLNHQFLNQPFIFLLHLKSKVAQEIFKFLIAHTSLREIELSYSVRNFENNQAFTSTPGVMSCLKISQNGAAVQIFPRNLFISYLKHVII